MNLREFISFKEFKLLLITGLSASSFAFVGFFYSFIEDYKNVQAFAESREKLAKELEQSDISVDSVPHTKNSIRLFYFLSFLIFAALLKSKKFILSTVLTIFSLLIFLFEQNRGWQKILRYELYSRFNFLELVFWNANIIDYLTGFFVAILLIWQISIFCRFAINQFQAKIPLR